MNIGNWIRRTGRKSKWHLLESVVAGDAVTRCGRRMLDPGLEVSALIPLTRLIGQPQLCRQCHREPEVAEPFPEPADALDTIENDAAPL